MAKMHLQKDIKKQGSYTLSDGTLNTLHLLAKAHDLLLEYNINLELKKEIRDVFIVRSWQNGDDMWTHVYHDRVQIVGGESGEAAYLWNERVHDYFNEIAPEGYYFGTLEGDGSCFGWWRSEE